MNKRPCPRCLKNPAVIHATFGITHCKECKAKDIKIKEAPIFSTPTMAARIQEQRSKHEADIVQPFLPDGKPNPDFVSANSKEDNEQYFTKEELKNL